MAENTRKCDGKCMECNVYQRQFCAVQLSYNNMKQLDVLGKEIKNLSEKIEAMQNNEASIFDPNEETQVPLKAQKGVGAEE